MRIVLLRHGESEGNARGVVQGRVEFGLTERGIRQADATAARLLREGVSLVVTSPLDRARRTADAVALQSGARIEVDDRLAEYDIGLISGLTAPEIRERFPHIAEAWRNRTRPEIPGEEGRQAFLSRVQAVLHDIARSAEEGQRVVAVTHGGVINAACHVVLGLPYPSRRGFRVDNCSVTEIARDRTGGLVLASHNDVCHLPSRE